MRRLLRSRHRLGAASFRAGYALALADGSEMYFAKHDGQMPWLTVEWFSTNALNHGVGGCHVRRSVES